jgi:tol-pal system protein YbgF
VAATFSACSVRVRSFLAPAILLAGLAGCAGEDKQLDSMRSELDQIESSRDEADRKAALPEDGPSETPPPNNAVSVAPPGGSLPPREVILGGVEGFVPEDYADTEDSSPRPTIRVIGATRPGRGGWRGEDQVEQSGSSGDDGAGGGGAQAAPPPALDPAAKRAYDAALALVAARQYPQALDALAAFLVKWPDHPYADNAMYWRGEAYFARGEYARATEQFEGVLSRFPAGNKVPDALLKLGVCAQKAGDPARARAYFDRLAQQFPESEAARRIPSVAPAVGPAPAPSPEDHR